MDESLSDNAYIRYILEQHKEKDFVQRVLSPEKYPSIDLGGGHRGTHLMMWGNYEGTPIVFPSIVNVGGGLQRKTPAAAFVHAIKTGEFIPFQNGEDADWFSRNYKMIWQK